MGLAMVFLLYKGMGWSAQMGAIVVIMTENRRFEETKTFYNPSKLDFLQKKRLNGCFFSKKNANIICTV